jgi:rare lipoprotein A
VTGLARPPLPRRLLAPALLVPLLLGGCAFMRAQPKPSPHYVLGPPYEAGGVWYYPREDFAYSDTGLATVYDRPRGLTAAGELWDPAALQAAHPTLQLPALARVTNLENGRQILVRIDDRGPGNPGRLIGLTPRAAELLGAPGTRALRVKVELEEAASRGMAGRGDAPVLAVQTAPAGAVQTESLAPPPGMHQAAQVQTAATAPVPVESDVRGAAAEVPLRLPEQVWLTQPRPGQLSIECGAFSRPDYANVQRNRLVAFGARVTTDYYAPRDRAFIVRTGTFPTVAAAEAALRRILPQVPDARIVVE